MGKEILFCGPAGAGKTLFREIFFERESSLRLLEHLLEPYDIGKIINFKLREIIGSFDFDNQESQLWLEINKNSIFQKAKIIIVVIAITAPIEDILNFTKMLINFRNEVTPTSIIYLLLHKIDLMNDDELTALRLFINNELLKENLLKITFTSIHKQFFLPTFALFIDILKTFIYKNIAIEKVDIDLFKNGVYVLYTINEDSSKNISHSEESLRDRLKISEQQFDIIINVLKRVDFIMKSKSEDKINLTIKGEIYLKELVDNFTVEDFAKIERKSLESKVQTIKILHPFLGFMIADTNGIQFLVTEVEEGVFGTLMKSEDPDKFFDYELIPLFISALEKFSDKINIKNLIGFTLKGTNIKIQTFKYEFATVTLFMRHDTAFKSMKSHVNNWFKTFIENNKNRFRECIETGNIELIFDLKNEGREWLENLNKKYRVMDLDLNIFDEKLTKDLFQKLDEFSKEDISRSPKFLKKINKLKQNLIKAALEEDLNSIKEISKKISALNFIE